MKCNSLKANKKGVKTQRTFFTDHVSCLEFRRFSSCLEFRRFGSQLAQRGVDCYAVDLIGWGYTQLEGVTDFSASAKVEALQSFLKTVVREPFVISGASLGGAAAIETAARNINCQGLVLIDAQGFVDGIGPMA